MLTKSPPLDRQKHFFWAALLLICAVSLASVFSTQRLVALNDQVEHSQHVLLGLNKLVSDLKDVETGARGYVITRDERYLEPYRTGVEGFETARNHLRRLARDNRNLQRHLDGLERLGRRRIETATRMVDDRARGRAVDDLRVFVDAGKLTMDQIRRTADAVIAAEQSAYRRRQEAVVRQTWLTNIAVAVGVATSLAALAWLFTMRGREVARRRQAEKELRALNTELEDRVQARTAEVARSRELLNAVIENMPDTVFLKDMTDEYKYVLINGAGEKLFGRQRNDLLGRIDHELFPRSQATQCRSEDQEVASSGRQLHVPERPVDTDQGVRLIESRKVPITGDDGNQRFILGIVRDVTEQKALESQLRQMQRIDAVGQLTGGIAHDFNNLLAIITGNLDLLREKLPDGSDPAEMADEALGAASRGAELVRRLLAFARKQHLEPTALDLNERLPSITALLRRTLGENIRIQVVPAPDLWLAFVDPTQVDDTLVNLAINARDAMPNGGSLSIETANVALDEDYADHHVEVTPGEYVMLAVSDTGTGMTPETIARAFEPFFTTKEEGRGTGLGLSQVYGWVKQSGGHIKIYSELGHGTTIKLYLPRACVDAGEAAQSSESAAALPTGRETVLVVEDNPNVRRLVVRQLTDLGYSTIEAEDGRAALEKVDAGAAFDLLLTDIIMPGGVTGYELAEQIGERRPDLKVLFTSGYTDVASRSGQQSRNGPLLSKPYRKQDLAHAVRALLDETK